SMGSRGSDAELDGAIVDIAAQNNMTPAQLVTQISADGMTAADLRASVRDEITLQRLRQSFAQSQISVTEGEVDAAMANEASGNQYHLAHILIGVAEGSTPDQIASAQARAEQLKAQLEAGAIEFQAEIGRAHV